MVGIKFYEKPNTDTYKEKVKCSMQKYLIQIICFGLISFGQIFAAQKVVEVDVVIYGGTSAGVTAAVQVRRMGKSCVLIEPGKHLGGVSSSGLGRTDADNTAAIGGDIELVTGNS